MIRLQAIASEVRKPHLVLHWVSFDSVQLQLWTNFICRYRCASQQTAKRANGFGENWLPFEWCSLSLFTWLPFALLPFRFLIVLVHVELSLARRVHSAEKVTGLPHKLMHSPALHPSSAFIDRVRLAYGLVIQRKMTDVEPKRNFNGHTLG